ncbi:MAG: peptidoglycan editing factor PgeF [Candidatus Schekmanbacteria bacterium]|nr:peptidoglycan editing factor PgeF [Candidatus Schekmanbacteria bacterium]
MSDKQYTLQTNNHIHYYTSDLLANSKIVHGFSTRQGNHGNDFSLGNETELRDQNRHDYCNAVGVDFHNLACLKQIHRDQIIVLEKTPESPPIADASITKQPGIVLAIQTADCVPILIADPENKIIAAVHAGWRGTVANILAKTLKKMFELGADPQKCLVAVGPCIGPCCYQVDNLVIDQLKAAGIPWQAYVGAEDHGHWNLNLAAINIRQARMTGIPQQRISRLDLCTACNNGHFFSYRREGKTGRMLNMIALSGD